MKSCVRFVIYVLTKMSETVNKR